jgi:hypothetical protein
LSDDRPSICPSCGLRTPDSCRICPYCPWQVRLAQGFGAFLAWCILWLPVIIVGLIILSELLK